MRDAGKTIFVVTHQALLLDGVADEFVWMDARAELWTGRRLRASRQGECLDEHSLWALCWPRW